MDAEVKQRWVEALRSGKYRQGTHALKRKLKEHELKDDGIKHAHCCLGVLCEIEGLEEKKSSAYPDHFLFGYDNLFALGGLINSFRHEMGIPHGIEADLIKFNDHRGKSFDEIADYIEEKL